MSSDGLRVVLPEMPVMAPELGVVRDRLPLNRREVLEVCTTGRERMLVCAIAEALVTTERLERADGLFQGLEVGRPLLRAFEDAVGMRWGEAPWGVE